MVRDTRVHTTGMRSSRGYVGRTALVAVISIVASFCTLLPGSPAVAAQAAVGQGFTITASDLAYILKQIKIAEAHVANTTSATGPCGALLGTGPNQIRSPLLSFGLRTVDGSCNNLIAGQETFGAADEVFLRLATPTFRDADDSPAAFGPPASTSYAQKKGLVFDAEPRVVSNLIVDQTSANPAAISAAEFPVRTQGNPGVLHCTTDPDINGGTPGVPAGCVPSGQTLFIPNVTTDVGLSPPFNSLFTLFGQFFDHGIDQTVKGGGTAFVPLQADDPLIAGLDRIPGNADDPKPGDPTFVPEQQRFMVLTRGQNQAGADGVLGTDDDIQDATNTDSPWVDQSQTYTSHPSHQVFLREYVNNTAGRPVATGRLLNGPGVGGSYPGSPDGRTGMATWAAVKRQAATLLGLRLTDLDVTNIPMIAADPYGKFIPGPARGLPQYVTTTGLVEGDTANPVPVPANTLHFDTPFETDIAHNADPGQVGPCTSAIGVTPRVPAGCQSPDADTTPSPDFAKQPPGTYDDEMLNAHFACGDGRCNENIGLSAIHQVFHSEHDRLVEEFKSTLTNDTSTAGSAALSEWKLASGAGGWNGERLFQAARFVTEMEYQHIVFEEFARKIQPLINPFQPFAFTQTELNPAIRAEFAHAVYRFGHSMLTETISRRNEDRPGPDGAFGTSDDVRGSENDISLLDGFLNPPAYTDGGPAGVLTPEQAAGSIIMGMSDQTGNEIDEFVTDTLRNNLLGLPLDLATINMARARSEGVPPLNVFRRELFNATNDGQLKPYVNWIDVGENLKHPESLVNFVAAYGQHPTILAATTLAAKRAAAKAIVVPGADPVTAPADIPADASDFLFSAGAWANVGSRSTTGVDRIDLWVGGLAERTNLFGGLLGSTFNYVFEQQLTELQDGDRLYYLARTPGMNLRAQLEGNSFAELAMRNTNAHALKADAFGTADCKFELKKLNGTAAGYATSGHIVADDPDSECDESAVLLRQPDGTIKYRGSNTSDPAGINGQAVYNGTPGVDRIYGGYDNDTFWGGAGNDIIEGGDGADVALGGEGDDIITDIAGDDVPKGGPGNDAIDAGPGLDIIMGGDGHDFTNGGANINETFAGAGDDFAIAGDGEDAVFGDSGDDWEEGGNGADLLMGDSSNLFFLDDSQRPGHDVLIGQGGDDDYDMEGGDDIGLAGPGVEKVAGASGYDWEIGLLDPQPQDSDLDLPIPPLDILQVGVRDKFNEVEALSGGRFADTLRGDSRVPSAVGGAGFIGCDVLDQQGLNRIAGLDPLIPPLTTPLATVVAASASQSCPLLSGPVWGDGNILLGGAGSDLIEGRGADDIIDGDKYLSVRLSVRTDRNNPASELGSASGMQERYLRDAAGALVGPTLMQSVFAGTVNPGNIVVVREILSPPASDASSVDTAVFSGPRANYTIDVAGDVVTVTQTGANVVGQRISDGTDTLRNIERLQFTDGAPLDVATPPSPPVLSAAVAGDTTATVGFAAGPPNGAAPIAEFRVQVLVDGVVRRTIAGVSPTATTAVVTGLANDVPVTFRVLAVSEVGLVSAPSNESGPVTPVNLAPGAPVIGLAFGGDTSATVNWTRGTGATATAALSQFQVQVLVDGSVVRTMTGLDPAATSAVVTGLSNGTTYTFRVIAVSQANVASPPSAQSNPVTPATLEPQVTSTTPADGATGVPVTANATATFDRSVSSPIWTAAAELTNSATGARVASTVTYDDATRTVTVNPNADLDTGTSYRLTLLGTTGNGIRDVAGARLVTTAIVFRTEADSTPPSVTRVRPADNAVDVRPGRNVVIRFSEPVIGISSASLFLREIGGPRVAATLVANGAGTRVVLNPNQALARNTRYRIVLAGGPTAIRDVGGNALAGTTFDFRTRT